MNAARRGSSPPTGLLLETCTEAVTQHKGAPP